MAKASSYATRIQQSQEDKDQKAVAHSVKQAELQLQSDILETELSIVNAELSVESAKAGIPFNSQNIVAAENELEGYQNGMKKLLGYKAELFPAGK